jgi:hypothetical protein
MAPYPGGTGYPAAPGFVVGMAWHGWHAHVVVYSLHRGLKATIATCSGTYNALFIAENFAEQQKLMSWLLLVLMVRDPEGGGGRH